MVAGRSARSFLTVAVMILALSCQQSGVTSKQAPTTPSAQAVPVRFGLVVGQIRPCRPSDYLATPVPPPGHPAGTVTVLRGSITWVPGMAGGFTPALPTEAVIEESIPADGGYRFKLSPGPYVLVAHYHQQPFGLVEAWAPVSVVAWQTTREDVPGDRCI